MPRKRGKRSRRKLTPGDTDEKIEEYCELFNQAWEEIRIEEEEERRLAEQRALEEEEERRRFLEENRRATRSSTGSLPPPRSRDLSMGGVGSGRVQGAEGEGAAGGGGGAAGGGGGEEMDIVDGAVAAMMSEVGAVAGPSGLSLQAPGGTPTVADGTCPVEGAAGGTEEGEGDADAEMISNPDSDIQEVEIDIPAEPIGAANRRSKSRGGAGEEVPLIPISVGKVSDGIYHVEGVVDARIAFDLETPFESVDDVQYKVKWKGWPSKYNSWEDDANISGSYAKLKFWRIQLARSAANNKMIKVRRSGSGIYEGEQATESYDFFDAVCDF